MGKYEREKLVDTLDVWSEECETFHIFYKVFKKFLMKPDALEKLIYGCLQIVAICEYLFSAQFISTEKYLKLKVTDRLDEIETKNKRIAG